MRCSDLLLLLLLGAALSLLMVHARSIEDEELEHRALSDKEKGTGDQVTSADPNKEQLISTTDRSGTETELGDVVVALSDAISGSQQHVEHQVIELREDNSAQLAAVVAAVNQSADRLASLAETAEETHGFLQTIAESLASIKAMLHQFLQRVPVIGLCEEPYFIVGSECFLIVNEQMKWHDARSHCQAEGDDLAEPDDIEMLRQYLQDERFVEDYWLGGTDTADEGEWLWVSGHPVKKEWMEGHLNDEEDQDCLDFRPLNYPILNDYFCNHEQRFICERTPIPLENTTATTDVPGKHGGVPDHRQRVVCFLGSWAVYRPGMGKFSIEDIDATLCNNLIYSFVGLDEATYKVKSLDPEYDINKKAFERFVGLKKQNPDIEITVAIGGWAEGYRKYSIMAAYPALRRVFIDSIVTFIKKHNFDGLDLMWEYPVKEDKENFVSLVKELRQEFDKYDWLLTASLGAGKSTIDSAYNMKELARYLDYIHVKAYDYHGKWDGKTGHNAPLYSRDDESDSEKTLNVEYTINYFLQLGCPPEKLVMGLGLYGRTFRLRDPSNPLIGAPTRTTSFAGPYTQEDGFLGYNEICEKQKTEAWLWKIVWQKAHQAPYMFMEDMWVAYDDDKSLHLKISFAQKKGLAGVMAWSIDTDDFMGTCFNKTFPLLRVINKSLADKRDQRPAQPGDAFSNNMNDLLQAFTQIFHGSITQAAGWCEPPLKLIGDECFFVSDGLVDAENAAVESEMTWRDAQEFCKENGGDLAEPSDPEALREIMTDGVLYWLGSKYDESERTWKWVSGKPATHGITIDVDVNPWFCSIMYDMAGSVRFDAYDCEQTQRWICEKPNPSVASSNETAVEEESLLNQTTESPTWSFSVKWSTANATERPSYQGLCEEPYFIVGSECFLIVDEQLSWHDARSHCQAEGYDLAEPENIEMLCKYLQVERFVEDYWLGGTDTADEGEWLWVSGHPVKKEWMEGHLIDEEDKDCLDFRPVNYPILNGYFCNHGQRFICEKLNPSVAALNETNLEDEVSSYVGPSEEESEPSYILVGSELFLIPVEKLSWSRALRACEQLNGYLAEPQNLTALKNYMIKNNYDDDYWIGGSYQYNEGSWIWTRSSNPIIREWMEGQPDGGRNKNCLDFRPAELTPLHDYSCHVTQKYICQKDYQPSGQTRRTFIPETEESCEDPYVMIGSECFKIVDYKEEKWHDAREDCKNNGGDLAVLSDMKILQNYLNENNMEGDYWLGGSDIDVEGTWLWLSGEEITSGFDYEPYIDDTENCLDFRTAVLMPLHDYYCSKRQKYICEKPLISTPVRKGNETELCEEPFFALSDTCYQVVQKSYSWYQARQLCQEQDADLLQNHSLTLLHNYLRDHDYTYSFFWMGASDEDEEGSWKWLSGKPVPNATWDGRQFENNINRNCMQLRFNQNNNYYFDHAYCYNDENSNVICEKSITPSNYKKLYTQIGSEYFLVVNEFVEWNRAQEICQAKGGELAQPKDLDLLRKWIYNNKSINSSSFWLGASDIEREGDWLWLNGSNVEHGWMKDEPDNRDCDENCLLFMTMNGPSLNDFKCYRTKSFICELNDDEPKAKEDPFFTLGDEKFLVVEEFKTWEEARTSCRSFGGDLAEPKNLELLKSHLREHIQTDSDYWIGGSDRENEGSWKWVSGDTVNMSLWIDGGPNGDENENCLDFQPLKNPPLNDYECEDSQYYICEKTPGNRNVILDEECKSPFVQLGSECLLIITDCLMSWQEARNYCQRNYADLATLNDINRLRKHLLRNDIEYEYWVDGSKLNSFWRDGEPDDNNESKCIIFQSGYRPSYNAYACSGEQSFICEKTTIGGKSEYDIRDKYPNNDLSSNFEINGFIDYNIDETTEVLGTTVFF